MKEKRNKKGMREGEGDAERKEGRERGRKRSLTGGRKGVEL